MKGSALNVIGFSKVYILNSIFRWNGPVYSDLEKQFSPYFRGFLDTPITFLDPNCEDEFEYMDRCYADSEET